MSDEAQRAPDTPQPTKAAGSRVAITPGLVIAAIITGVAAFGVALVVTYRSASGISAATPDAAYRGTLIEPPRQLSDFTLTDQHGEPVSLSDFRGKLVLMYFGYTNCPDVCPLTLSEYGQIRERLGDHASEIAFVFVSVDPARDTPERMAEFLSERGVGDFVTGMTGDADTLEQIGGEYGLFVDIEAHEDAHGEDYEISHTSASFLIDREGSLRMLFSIDPEQMTLNPEMVAGRIIEMLGN